jgi:simple sugar transport system ATP-binding protein
VLAAEHISKRFGKVEALRDVSLEVPSRCVTCLLGDNGAGKSTLIKILTGVLRPDAGEITLKGEPVEFGSPRDALDRGIGCVYQDLAMIPLMPLARNFFVAREPRRGIWPFRTVDWKAAGEITIRELRKVGIEVRNAFQPVGTLSGGERQAAAIARAVYFGAEVLILDEPTSALGVSEANMVLRIVDDARERGLAVVFISHNVVHATAIADRYVILNRGRLAGTFDHGRISRQELQDLMAGGRELVEFERARAGAGS